MKKLRKYLLIFALPIVIDLRSQTNLITNGSFEDTITCSTHVTYQLFAQDWWMFNTVDYYRNLPYTACPNSGMAGTFPYYAGGFQFPHYGNSCVGIVMLLSSNFYYYREYIQQKLNDTLKSGQTYCVSFWWNEANRAKYAVDRLGVYFSSNGVNLSNTTVFTQYNPQITTPLGQFLNDTMNWHQYRTLYVATGNETYFTLGNFYDSVQTNTQLYPNNSSPLADSYYLIDDISILPTDLPCVAGKDTSVCKNDSIYIGRPPEIGLDNVWTEISTGTQVGVGSGIWLKPDTSATYVVSQDLCGAITTDTIRVVVNCIDGIDDNDEIQDLKIFPLPANDVLNIHTRQLEGEVWLIDILGNLIEKVTIGQNAQIDISHLPNGIYILKLFSKAGMSSKKILIQN